MVHDLDKNWKLQRYDRKDYTELVDFPVEIVGRDGVVRRYTFEDSIRLYQRRITFAPIRYRDNDLVRAETNHCRSRIDQLRRSYFHRYGWGTPEGQPDAQESFGDLAGELAAFICRVLGAEGRPEIRFDPIEVHAGANSTWYVTPDGARSGMILYVHRFAGSNGDDIRESFFASLKQLERMGRGGGDSERLLAFHHTIDCGFVLTGRGGDFGAFIRSKDGSNPVDLASTPWDEVLEIIRKGDYEAALRRCRDLASEQPYHRNAYVAGAMIAGFLGEHIVAEDLAMVGSRYFPRDGALQAYLGQARAQLGRTAEAEEALREAVRLAPEMVSARALLVVHLIQARRHRDALEVLEERAGTAPDDRRADAELQHLQHAIRNRRRLLWCGVVLMLASIPLIYMWANIGLAIGFIGGGVAALGVYLFHRQLDTVLARQRFEEISQGLRRLHRRTRGDTVVS